jgi:plasmid stabilization system protein ParE
VARLIVSRDTLADLDEILAYLTSVAGKPVALRYGERFRAAFRHLMDYPATGAMRPRLAPDMRIWFIAPYVVFYRFAIDDDTVRVLRILHGRRSVTERLFKNPMQGN